MTTPIIPIIPAPVSCQFSGGAPFAVTARTVILPVAEELRATADHLARLIKTTVTDSVPAGGNVIILSLDPELRVTLGTEGCRLTVTAEKVVITGGGAAGVFYGVQSLRQLLPPGIERFGWRADGGKVSVPALAIVDKPRFGWRGLMVDSSRHFFTVAELKHFIEAMALQKLNVFHWHLIDDQGWRLEIKKYPKLTGVGAWREESPVYGDRDKGDGRPYGGFYTQAEAREIVAFAAERFITVVPEIELPGHAAAAIAAYPEFGNGDIDGFAPKVAPRWNIHPYTYAPSEATFGFLADVMAEVATIFPSAYVHIGGDEALKDQWEKSAFAQKVIKEQGLKDEHELQSWFIRRVEKILASHGRRLIGWDEIQEGGLSPTATMMVWRDWKWAEHAISRGNDVIMSPTTHCYLDHYQADPKEVSEPEAIGGNLPLEKVYGFDPVPPELPKEKERHVLGMQGNLWAEYIPRATHLEYMAFPRGSALAEVGWTPLARKDWADFQVRLEGLYARFDQLNVNYRRKVMP